MNESELGWWGVLIAVIGGAIGVFVVAVVFGALRARRT